MFTKKIDKKGFIMIIATAFVAALLAVSLTLINIGTGELIQTKAANNTDNAYYMAVSGAEMMYSFLKSKEGQIVTWPQSVPAADSVVRTRASGGTVVGTFSATANTVSSEIFGIASTGTVNNRNAAVTVKYGMSASTFTNGYPIGSVGSMTLAGQKWWILRSWVRAEGPLASGTTVDTNNFVKVNGNILENQPFVQPSFWFSYNAATGRVDSPKMTYDTNGDSSRVAPPEGSGRDYAIIADAGGDEAKEAIFHADDINNDGRIDNKDAFIAYYTIELNKMGLGIGEGQANYYSGDRTFQAYDIPSSTQMIFVNGSVTQYAFDFPHTDWWGSSGNHAIIATGDVTIVQPSNGPHDTLTVIAYGDVYTGGLHAFSGVNGNLVVYANGDFGAYYGGKSSGTIFAGGNIDIDTVLPIPGLLNRDINKGDIDWSNPANWPPGLPQNYNTTATQPFIIKDERFGYVPVWQRD